VAPKDILIEFGHRPLLRCDQRFRPRPGGSWRMAAHVRFFSDLGD
jgi:hypothetical protein